MSLSLVPTHRASGVLRPGAASTVILCLICGCAGDRALQVVRSRPVSAKAEIAPGPVPAESTERRSVEGPADRSESEATETGASTDIRLVSKLSSVDTPESGTFWTLASLQQLAMQHNPAIRQAAAVASQADGIHNQTGLKPNPTIGYFADEIGDDSAAGLHGAFVSQTFVRGDKLKWNEQVVGHEVQIRRWNEKTQRQRVRTDLSLHYYTALAAQKRLALTREFHKVAQRGVEISEARVQGQLAGKADILQSEVQLSQIDLMIRQAELELDGAWQQLASVAGLPQLERRPLHGDFDLADRDTDLDGTLQQLLAQSPQVAAGQYAVSRAQAALRRQQVQKVSNITTQVGVGHDDSTGDEFANVQVSIPVPVHNRNQGNVHAAWADYCAATQNLRRLKMQMRRDLAGALRDYQSAQAAVEQYRDVIIPRAQETLELMKQAQEGGEYDFLRVLTARRAFFDANVAYVSSLQQLAAADARIDGMLLTGGLDGPQDTPLSTGLRGQALSQQ